MLFHIFPCNKLYPEWGWQIPSVGLCHAKRLHSKERLHMAPILDQMAGRLEPEDDLTTPRCVASSEAGTVSPLTMTVGCCEILLLDLLPFRFMMRSFVLEGTFVRPTWEDWVSEIFIRCCILRMEGADMHSSSAKVFAARSCFPTLNPRPNWLATQVSLLVVSWNWGPDGTPPWLTPLSSSIRPRREDRYYRNNFFWRIAYVPYKVGTGRAYVWLL